jgi:uncharacterized Fe-S cluster-containing radical SAM superfamily protein
MADGQAVPGAAQARPGGEKFLDPDITATGATRASVAFDRLETLWVNTGTLCNIECAHCYIESSPSNDRLAYFTLEALLPFLDEAEAMGAREIGFTGGEPFMNPDMIAMMRASLERGFSVLVLTNAMRPMMRPQISEDLLALQKEFGARMKLRVSLDHFDASLHDRERGPASFAASLAGLAWLSENGFAISVAGRLRWNDDAAVMREGFAALFAKENIPLDAEDLHDLILFPEMDVAAPVPEITSECWDILGKRPEDMMCASARMVVHRKGEAAPAVLSCTLLAYDRQFEMGASLAQAARPVKLNHPHCAKFCVLGGASCSG